MILVSVHQSSPLSIVDTGCVTTVICPGLLLTSFPYHDAASYWTYEYSRCYIRQPVLPQNKHDTTNHILENHWTKCRLWVPHSEGYCQSTASAWRKPKEWRQLKLTHMATADHAKSVVDSNWKRTGLWISLTLIGDLCWCPNWGQWISFNSDLKSGNLPLLWILISWI